VNLSSLQNLQPSRRSRRAPWLTVVIVNYNGWTDVCRLAGTLAATPEVASGAAEVVVIDNASPGPIAAEVLPLLTTPGLRLLVRDDNGGFSAGVNDGWHAARGPWLLVLNPDVVVSDSWLGEVVSRVRRFEADPASAPGVVGFGLCNPDGSPQPSVGAFPSLSRALWEQLIPRSRRKYQADWRTRAGVVPWVTGACMLVNTRLCEELGGMDEDFFLYYEEVAFCRSAHCRGWRVEFDPSVMVTHLRPLQNRTLSPKMRVITRHSKLLYFRKHLPRWQFLALSWIVTLEATIFGLKSSLLRRTEDVRSWQAIRKLARAFRAGDFLRGRDVLGLAESVTRPGEPLQLRKRPDPPRNGPARKRRGTRNPRPLQERKDGTS
jgi:N-acetylglucosaminyl-diphospho-decaprenol L-rhamnosyltransferase